MICHDNKNASMKSRALMTVQPTRVADIPQMPANRDVRITTIGEIPMKSR